MQVLCTSHHSQHVAVLSEHVKYARYQLTWKARTWGGERCYHYREYYRIHCLPRPFDKSGHSLRSGFRLREPSVGPATRAKDGSIPRCSQCSDSLAVVLFPLPIFIHPSRARDIHTCWIVFKGSHLRNTWICDV